MGIKTRLAILLAASLILTGCAGSQRTSRSGILADSELVNIHLLAGRLTMVVNSIEKSKVELGNSDDSVTLYLDADAVYVNSSYVGAIGRTKKINGLLCVRANLEDIIRAALPAKKSLAVIAKPTITKPKPLLPSNRSKWLIIIDPGHGGKDPGAISPYGFYEKTVNLDVATQVAKMLSERGYRVKMTRADDRFVELNERAAIANRSRANLFVSIHADTCATSTINGFTVYISRSASSQSRRLASLIDAQMKKTGTKSKGTRESDFRVLVRSRCPAVLIELGYLSNYWEEKKLKDKKMQRILAGAITSGIVDYTNR